MEFTAQRCRRRRQRQKRRLLCVVRTDARVRVSAYIFENAVDAIAGARASKRSRQTGTTSFGNERGPRDRQTREPAALINRTPTQSPPARSTVPASTLPKALLYNSKFQSPNIGRSRSRLSVILFLGVSVIFFSVHGRVAPKRQREREILTSSEESHDFDWR